MPYLAGYVTPQDFGAVGNGVADDTAAVQAAVTYLQGVGDGTLFYPPGTYLCTPTANPAVSVSGNGIRMVGSGEGASTIKKNGNGVLFSFTGTTSPSSGATHVRNCSVENLSFNGNGMTGSVLQLYYNDNFYARDVNISGNSDVVVDGVEWWDSRFFNTAIVNCGGGVNSTTAPNVWIRNASAASGVGASTGNSNNLHFIGCRFEGSLTGAFWVAQGTSNSSNPNNIKVLSCKFEADAIQGGPLVQTDNTTKAVLIDDCNFQLGGFAGGYSTAQRVISYSGGNHIISNCTIGNSGSATISDGLFLHAVGGSSITVENVIGGYTTNPTVSHVNFDVTATGSYSVSNTPTAGGTQFGGTPPSMLFNLPRNLQVGSNAALGDNGVGEIQLANATTVPSTNPTGGVAVYARSGGLLTRDPNGGVFPLIAGPETAATTGALAESVPRTQVSASSAFTSGNLLIQSVFLPAGVSVGHIGFGTGTTAGVTMTHWWVALLDNTYKQQAHSTDQTSGAIAASTWFNLAMATPFVTAYSGTYYLALTIAATTMPTILQSGVTPAAQFWTGTSAPTPVPNGVSSTGLTTPGTDGTTVYTAPSAASAPYYMYAAV